MPIGNYDDVTGYPLDPEVQEDILQKQTECTFIWGPKTGWAVGVLMTYIWKDGSFWVTATEPAQAHRRDPTRPPRQRGGLEPGHGPRPREGDHRQGPRDHPHRPGDPGLVLPAPVRRPTSRPRESYRTPSR